MQKKVTNSYNSKVQEIYNVYSPKPCRSSKSDLCDLFEILISVGCRHLCTSLSSDPNFPRDSPAILARHVIRLLTIEFLCAKNRLYLVPVVTELIIKQVLMAVNNRLNLVRIEE